MPAPKRNPINRAACWQSSASFGYVAGAIRNDGPDTLSAARHAPVASNTGTATAFNPSSNSPVFDAHRRRRISARSARSVPVEIPAVQIPIPGHHPVAVALYDRRTANLMTGDNIYPDVSTSATGTPLPTARSVWSTLHKDA